jgi:hypothetical protein
MNASPTRKVIYYATIMNKINNKTYVYSVCVTQHGAFEYKKVMFALEQAMKAQTGRTGTALLFL